MTALDIMPTSYLVEKLGYLAKSRDILKDGIAQVGTIKLDNSELDWILQNAESVVKEIKKWRGESE